MKFSFINLGCKINQIEMEQASEGLVGIGYEYSDDPTLSDFLLINTCTVTSKADRKSLQTIRSYSRSPQLKHIFVTGCYSELEPELAAKIHPKNHIVAQRDKGRMPQIIDALLREKGENHFGHQPAPDKFSAFKLARVSPSDLETQQVNFFKHTRAFVKIQDGCNAFCSYCRIPYARGAPVSRSHADIMTHLDRLKASGIRELVLSGINIGKYQAPDTDRDFSELLGDLLDQAGDIRIKISSIEPFSLDEGFFALVGHPNLAPHIHLPLQGLSDEILTRMNRRYRLEDYRRIIDRIYAVNPYFSIATDVIVGYPGESDEVYQAGKIFLEECGISKIHVFPFSSRPFTDDFPKPSDDLSGRVARPHLPQATEVAEVVKKSRSQDLRSFSDLLERKFLQKLGQTPQSLIVEGRAKSPLGGGKHSHHLKHDSSDPGKIWFQGTTEFNIKGMISLPDTGKIDDQGEASGLGDYQGRVYGTRITQIDPVIFELMNS